MKKRVTLTAPNLFHILNKDLALILLMTKIMENFILIPLPKLGAKLTEIELEFVEDLRPLMIQIQLPFEIPENFECSVFHVPSNWMEQAGLNSSELCHCEWFPIEAHGLALNLFGRKQDAFPVM